MCQKRQKNKIDKKQYDCIAESYEEAEINIKKYQNMPQILELAPKLEGKTVLDLGCGNGLYSEFAFIHGAKRVLGVDISEAQIQLAIQKCEGYDNAEFIASDFLSCDPGCHRFDIIFSLYLLNYFLDQSKISKACRKMSDCLEQDGVIIGLVPNPDNPIRKEICYGISHRPKTEPFENGGIIVMSYYDDSKNPLGEIEYYYWDRETYETAFRNAGFHYEWFMPSISDEFLHKFGPEYSEVMAKNPTFMFFRLRKA